ncbi:putative zinc-binding metallopeptidase [Amaricoccus sp.]|uniref:zinc-binding metallopeptidase family protein n=1 Tax=Amaricoccus sp. TaxID=1872485 RepID=UPI001B5FA3CF|nr:putative zinc-binding metallopeptidase [Amaricoccus sp.]MBP7000093.1 putative zinc-binding metallopeptidase [Amaricoccus sp.]
MRVFTCRTCGQLVYFENGRCERCGSELGFLPETLRLETLVPAADGGGLETVGPNPAAAQRCANFESAGCNWLTPVGPSTLCVSCALGRRIPDLGAPENVTFWREAEAAKRRLVYALLRLRLPLAMPTGAPLVFDILSDAGETEPVLTGHSDGLITINLAEADPAERERRRADLGEAYRTLLGHFRHEVGHFYWDALVRDGGKVEECRAVFGDESADYDTALQSYYANGAPPDWQGAYVSRYATMHPWEDFAETWAHYLHVVDALDTAAAFGMKVDPAAAHETGLNADIGGDYYRAGRIEGLVEDWLPLAYAVNNLNRSLGQPDLYPFVLSPSAIAKLGFVQDLINGARAG